MVQAAAFVPSHPILGRPRPSSLPAGMPDRMKNENNIVRFASDGVPIMVIARGLRIPADVVEAACERAVRHGLLVTMPAHDWLTPALSHPRAAEIEALLAEMEPIVPPLMLLCELPRQEARFLAALLVRGAVAQAVLCAVISEKCDLQQLNVYAHRIRTKVPEAQLDTLWGRGYCMPDSARNTLCATIAVQRARAA